MHTGLGGVGRWVHVGGGLGKSHVGRAQRVVGGESRGLQLEVIHP